MAHNITILQSNNVRIHTHCTEKVNTEALVPTSMVGLTAHHKRIVLANKLFKGEAISELLVLLV